MSSVQPAAARSETVMPWARRRARAILRFVYVHNPLYLLSACFVLHGTARLLPTALDQSTEYDPWPLLGLSCGYLIMLACVAVAIVRLGRVWEDARSILLIIVGLFVELSLALDAPLTQSPFAGRVQVLIGLATVLGISEGLFHGLRIRLPALFRVPYYLLLHLVYLYPLLLVRTAGRPGVLDTSWGIYLFSPVAALAFLTLLPAIRRGRQYVEDNGSPWLWPWYPWALVGMLIAGVCLRGYVLSLSFDPVLSQGYAAAMRLETSYGAYFLVPMLMAVAVLLLEIGLVESLRRVQLVALALPLACIALSFPNVAASEPFAEFLGMFTRRVGSPAFASMGLAVAFYGYALIRRVRYAEPALVVALLLMSLVRPSTVNFDTMAVPQPVFLWVVSGICLWLGIRRRDSGRTLLGICSAVGAIRAGLGGGLALPLDLLWLMMCLIAALVVAILFDDWLARWIRRMGAGMLFAACLVGLLAPTDMLAGDAIWDVSQWPYALVGASLIWAYLRKNLWDLCFALLNVAAGICRPVWELYVDFRDSPQWGGVRSYLVGFALLFMAASISALKGGIWVRLNAVWSRVVGTRH